MYIQMYERFRKQLKKERKKKNFTLFKSKHIYKVSKVEFQNTSKFQNTSNQQSMDYTIYLKFGEDVGETIFIFWQSQPTTLQQKWVEVSWRKERRSRRSFIMFHDPEDLTNQPTIPNATACFGNETHTHTKILERPIDCTRKSHHSSTQKIIRY